jgi:hypothetical protein
MPTARPVGARSFPSLIPALMSTVFIASPVVVAQPGVPTSPVAVSVDLTVTERLGLDRRSEPVTMGVPFPRGALKEVRTLRLMRDEKEVPAQFRILGRWLPQDSIRWVLVDVTTDLTADEVQSYALESGPGVKQRATPAIPLRIQEDADGYTVSTGAAAFRLSKKAFSLFEEVKLQNGTILVPPTAGKPRFGARITGLKACVTRPVPSPGNKGSSHFIYANHAGCTHIEDFTLTFTSGSDYEVTGSRSGPMGKGSMGSDFSGAGGRLVIPRDGWLAHARAVAGDRYTFRVIPEGTALSSEGIFETKVIEAGPLRSVIRVKGSFGPVTAASMEFTARYHFHAGSSRVKLVFTLENNGHGGRTGTGNARNADIGGVNCLFFDGMGLDLPLALGETRTASILGDADTPPLIVSVQSRIELYQDSGGGGTWDCYRNPKFHPRPNSYVTFRGYRVLTDGKKTAEGLRAVGALDLSDGSHGVTVGVRDFWQNCPKGLSADPDGGIAVELFPAHYAGDFPFRSGEHKTHEILFYFHEGDAKASGGLNAARGFSDPLRLEPTSAWFAKTRALGDLHPYDPGSYKSYETLNLSVLGLTPDGGRSKTSLIDQMERYNFFCWMDYGDVPMDFEGGRGQWGLKYDFDYQMARQYARTLRPGWWRLFTAAVRHASDIDVHHQPHYPGLHFVKGGSWAHSMHNEPGDRNPHRNRNHFTKDLCFGARGAATLHYLTGDSKARETCLELAENAMARYMSPQKDPGGQKTNNRMGWRGDACTLERLMEGYLLSGERKYLDRARWQIKSCAFDGRPSKHRETSLWSSAFYMMALARYVDHFPDDQEARSYLLAHLETLCRSITPDGGIYYAITPRPDGSVTGKGSSGMYNIMAADALAIAYRLTGDAKYLKGARSCFPFGIRAASWNATPETYTQVHSANGGTHGNFFMVVDAAARKAGR